MFPPPAASLTTSPPATAPPHDAALLILGPCWLALVRAGKRRDVNEQSAAEALKFSIFSALE
jgi:hypothetical protein